jgi:putative transposase
MTHQSRRRSNHGLYYVVLAGNGGSAIFIDDQDREAFTGLVTRFSARCNAQMHAYCWTQSDARMLLEVRPARLPSLMARIASQHATHINLKLGRKGDRVFNGRYRSASIVEDEDLLDVALHIHRTPLELALVDDLAKYQWSSHLAYLGKVNMPWVVTGLVLDALRRKDSAPDAYQSWVHSVSSLGAVRPTAEYLGRQTKQIGDALFLNSLMHRAEGKSIRFSFEEVTVAVLRWVQVSFADSEIENEAEALRLTRAMIADYVKSNRIATLDAASAQLGRSASALSEAIVHFKTLYPGLFGMTLEALLNGPPKTLANPPRNPEAAELGSGSDHGPARARALFGGMGLSDARGVTKSVALYGVPSGES